jgi:gamma-glutamylcyclotransferase
LYFFAYDTNLNKKLMVSLCPHSKPKFTAVLPNYKLTFTGWSRQWKGGITSFKSFRGERVKGAIYEIAENELKLLDKFYDYPAVYNRFNVMVWTDDGDPVESVTYIKKEQSTETKPSLEMLNAIRQGYKDWEIE